MAGPKQHTGRQHVLLAAGKLLETARQRRKGNSLTVPEAPAQALGPTAFGLLERYHLWWQKEAAYFVAAKKQRERKGLDSS